MVVFRELDLDCDGQLNRQELLDAYGRFGGHPEVQSVIEGLISEIDLNHNSGCHYEAPARSPTLTPRTVT